MKASANNNNNGGNAASITPAAASITSTVQNSQPNNSQKPRQQQRSQQYQNEVANGGPSDADNSSKWQHDKFDEILSQNTAFSASQTSSSGNGNGSSQSKGSKQNGSSYYNFKQDNYPTGQSQDAYDQSQSQSNGGANPDQGVSSASDTSSNNNNGGASSHYHGSHYMVNNGNGYHHYNNGYNNKRPQNSSNNGMQNNGYKKSTYGMGGGYQRDDNSGYYQGSSSNYHNNNNMSRYHQNDRKPMQTGGLSSNYGNGMNNGGMRSSHPPRQTILIYNKEASGYQSFNKPYGNMSGSNNYSTRYHENGSTISSNSRGGGGGHIKSYQNQGYGQQYNQQPYDQQRRKSFKDNSQQPYSSGKRHNQNHYYDDGSQYDQQYDYKNSGEVYSPTSQYDHNVKESEDDLPSSEVDQDETAQESADQVTKTKVEDRYLIEESAQQLQKQQPVQQQPVVDINKPKLIYSLNLKVKNQASPITIEIHENESIQEIFKSISSTFDLSTELSEALLTYIARKLEGIIPGQSESNISDNSNSKKGSEIKVQSSVYNKQQISSVNNLSSYFQQTPQAGTTNQFGHGEDLLNKQLPLNFLLPFSQMSLPYQQREPNNYINTHNLNVFQAQGATYFQPHFNPSAFPLFMQQPELLAAAAAAHTHQTFVPQQPANGNVGGVPLIQTTTAAPFIYQQPQSSLVSTNGNSSDQS